MYGASAPTTGFYIEGGYAYFYDAPTGTIKIAVSPRGGAGTVIAKGTAAYTAVFRAIQGLRPATQAQLDALSKPASVASAAAAPSALSTLTAAAPVTPFYQQGWFPPVVVLGVVALLGGFLVLRKN